MSETVKHTPGEWWVEIIKGSYKRPAYVKCGEKIIAHCIGDQLEPNATSIREAEANARLIAAAPEMLDMLHECADFVQPFNRAEELLDRIEVLIAKATGEQP